ncbi:hypothetical protein CPB83DRAFT_627329 [Crepidotus variabilis]|uniref:F-box domain-containing protein n=1 Tax=Crepidotus variabilis TaxID=179855 RepID=A0A9P6JUK4_9AGAR|nr:hypothetical protein CPB83DRAFT_627329 [Crepidotus variabilis]
MQTSNLISLSAELIFAIGGPLPFADLKQLRLSCRSLSDTISVLVLHSLHIFKEGSRLSEDVALLGSLADNSKTSPICLNAHTITFGYLDPGYSRADAKSSGISQSEYKNATNSIVTGILACKNLRKVRSNIISEDPKWLQSAILTLMQTIPSLRECVLNGGIFTRGFNISNLITLESLSITEISDDPKELVDSVSDLIAASPNLTSLEMVKCKRWSTNYSLHSLLAKISQNPTQGSGGCAIKNLRLEKFLVRFDSVALLHLKSLVSLSIMQQENIHATLLFADSSKIDTMCGSSPALWTALRESGIHLQEIEHDCISDALIEYLESFSGLRKLELKVQYFSQTNLAGALLAKFFSRAFPKHMATLETFSIDSRLENQWRCGPTILQALIECPKLKNIGIAVDFNQLTNPFALDKLDESPEGDIIKQLLDQTITHLPLLETISLHECRSNAPFEKCGIARSRRIEYLNNRIMSVIQKYRAPEGTLYLPRLSLSTPSTSLFGDRLDKKTVKTGSQRDPKYGGRLMYS